MTEYCHHWTTMRGEDGCLWLACTDPGCHCSYNWTLERADYERIDIESYPVFKKPREVPDGPEEHVTHPYSDDFGGRAGVET